MTVREWQELPPSAAAREVHQRLRTRLSPAQQHAVVAWLPEERVLAGHFAEAARGPEHPLGGAPYFAKDLFDVRGLPTFAGSTFLPEVRRVPAANSAVIDAAQRAGLVLAGKTHLHEFAYGITGENSHYGDCERPGSPGRTTGGSSSGSAAAVAAGIVPLAFGTDTGGSVRVPAAFCGVFGFRLAAGDPWIRDAFPLARSFDSAGWFTRTAVDMRLALQALVGRRPANRTIRGCYLELPGLDGETSQAFRTAAAQLAPAADQLTSETLSRGFAPSLDAYNAIVAEEAWQVHAPWADRYRDRYDPAVWDRLVRGRTSAPTEMTLARSTHTGVKQLWIDFFQTYDSLILPATPCGALNKSECTLENRLRLLSLTTPASLGGFPVLTLPVPLPSGLTTGLQIVVEQAQSPAISAALSLAEENAGGISA